MFDGLPGRPGHGDVYIHQYERGKQLWVFRVVPESVAEDELDGLIVGRGRRKGLWKRIHVGDEYPEDPADRDSDLNGYVLHVLDSGLPRWVKPATMRNYENSQYKRRRMAEKCGRRD